MEVYPRGSITFDQIPIKNYSSCELDMKKREQSVANRTSPSPREVVRPEPRRIVRTGYIFNSLDRLCCTRKSIILPTHEKDSRLDFINRILGKDDPENEIDDDGNRGQTGLFCGSPPVRTNNPVIHDIQFLQQAPVLVSSPLEESHGAEGSSSRMERVSTCGKSSFGGKPLVRIEGFTCGSSKASCCFVPAFA